MPPPPAVLLLLLALLSGSPGAPGTAAAPVLEFATDEELPVGTFVGDVKAAYFDLHGIRPADGSQLPQFHSLFPRVKQRGLLEVEPATGVIRVKQQLDREKLCPGSNLQCQIEFTVYQGSLGGDIKVEVVVSVKDINDNAPSWRLTTSPPEIRVVFRDGDQAGQFQIVQAADDGDLGGNGSLSYSLDNRGAPFSLRQGHENGRLYLEASRPVDREEQEFYNLTLIASDRGVPASLTGSVRLVVHVTDVNDHAPQFARQLFAPTLPVFEDAPVNSLVLTLNATDRDAGAFGKVVFELGTVGGSDQEAARRHFTVTPDGRVLIRRMLDFDTMTEKSLVFEVVARDDALDVSSRQSATATVSVAVHDRIDERPSIEICHLPAGCSHDPSGAPAPSVEENLPKGTRVAVVTVHDPDIGDHVTCVTGGDGPQASEQPAFALAPADGGGTSGVRWETCRTPRFTS